LITCLIGYDDLSRDFKVLSGDLLCGDLINYVRRYSEPEYEARRLGIRRFFSTYWVFIKDVPYVVIQVSEVVGDSLGEVISALACLEPNELLSNSLSFSDAEVVEWLGRCVRCKSLARGLRSVLTALAAHGRSVSLRLIKWFLSSLLSGYPLIKVSNEFRELFIDAIYLMASVASLGSELGGGYVPNLLKGLLAYLVSEKVPTLHSYSEDLSYLINLIVKVLRRSRDHREVLRRLLKSASSKSRLVKEVVELVANSLLSELLSDLSSIVLGDVGSPGLVSLKSLVSDGDVVRACMEGVEGLSSELLGIIRALGSNVRTYCLRTSARVKPTIVIGGCLRRVEGIELLNGSAGVYAVVPKSGMGLGTPELIVRYSRKSDLRMLRNLIWYLLNDGASTNLNLLTNAYLIDGFGGSIVVIKEVLKKDSLMFLKVVRTGATRVGNSAVPYTVVRVGSEYVGLRSRGVDVKAVGLSKSLRKPYALLALPTKVGGSDYVVIKLVLSEGVKTHIACC